MQAGAETELRDDWSSTPLHVAAVYGSVEVVKELLAFGADIEAKRISGDHQRPLHLAKLYGHPQVVEILLQNSADPFAQNRDRQRPSMIGWAKEVDDTNRTPSEEEKAHCMRLLAEGEKAWMKSSGKSLEELEELN